MTYADPSFQTWATLRGKWKCAHQAARTLRAAATRNLQLSLAGQGTGPTDQELIACERQEQLADALSIEMDNLIKDSFL